MNLLKYWFCFPLILQAASIDDPKLPKSVNTEITCESLTDKHLGPAEQWKLIQAEEEMANFEAAWEHDGLICDSCWGAAKEKCKTYFDSQDREMPEDCNKGLREAVNDHWVNGALLWFLSDDPRSESVCKLGEGECFPEPICDHTQGPAAYLILKSIWSAFHEFERVYEAVQEARTNVADRNPHLYDAVGWAEVTPDDLIARLLDTGLLFMSAALGCIPVVGGAIAATLILTLHTLPTMIAEIGKVKDRAEKDKANKWWVLNQDLETCAKSLQIGMKHASDELFLTGKFGSTENNTLTMKKLISDGVYSIPRDTDYPKLVAEFEKSLTRSIILALYRRLDYRIYFGPSEPTKPPNYFYGDLGAHCNKEHNTMEWATPVLRMKLDLRTPHCDFSPAVAFSGSKICHDGHCYEIVRGRSTAEACYLGPLPGASDKVLTGSDYGGLTFEELVKPILLDAIQHPERASIQSGPVSQHDHENLSEYKFDSDRTRPYWPICEYSKWAGDERWYDTMITPDALHWGGQKADRRSPPRIRPGCWNIQDPKCDAIVRRA